VAKAMAGAHTLFKSASLTARRRVDLEESKLVFLINVRRSFASGKHAECDGH